MRVSPSAVNRAHTAYDRGGLGGLEAKPVDRRQRENRPLGGEKAASFPYIINSL
jgi:hypothetical protein